MSLLSPVAKFTSTDEGAPDWLDVLVSIKNNIADICKHHQIDAKIPHDVLNLCTE